MKKLFPVFMALVLLLSACGLPGQGAEPTAIALPTAPPAEATATPASEALKSGQPGDETTSSVDGMAQVYLPGGKFQMGGFDTDAQPDEKPTHAVSLNPFWMDKVEVTNGMYQLCVKAGVCQLPRQLRSAGQENYFTNADFADYPVVYVSWEDAKTYCEWAGRRLPTEAEWELAARGTGDYRRFPWGENSPDGNLANYDYQIRDTTRVGSFPQGASPFGVLDLAGNVWEWVADSYSANYYNQTSEQNPTGPGGQPGGPKSIRGGSWADNFKDLRVSNRGYAAAPDLGADTKSEAYLGEANDRIGFRCAVNGQ